MYIWNSDAWPRFSVDEESLAEPLKSLLHEHGRLVGRLEALGMAGGDESLAEALANDVLSSSEIEGELLDPDRVRSSVSRALGLDGEGLSESTPREDGPVKMVTDAVQNYAVPVTHERLFLWHESLFSGQQITLRKILVGQYRNDNRGEMQIVSGPDYKPKVHYVAPPAEEVPQEIELLLEFVNDTQSTVDPILRAGLAHLWFELLHPFEDGNGRIGRAMVDLLLCRAVQSPHRYYRLSEQMLGDRKRYYSQLESAGKQSDLDVTPWMLWFVDTVLRAVRSAHEKLDAVVDRASFWDQWEDDLFNARQRKVVNLLLGGFDGKLSSSKYAKLTKVSQDTASRDLSDLLGKGVMVKTGGGRSTRFWLVGMVPEDGGN